MIKADAKPWKLRAVHGDAVLAACVTRRGAETERELSDIAGRVTFEPYTLTATPIEAPGCHPALTIEAERARCAAWNANATLAWQIRERQKARAIELDQA